MINKLRQMVTTTTPCLLRIKQCESHLIKNWINGRKRKTQYKVDPQPYKANKNIDIKLSVNGHFIMPVNTTHKLITFGYFLRVILMGALRTIINKSFKKTQLKNWTQLKLVKTGFEN